ncbi:unnamed protein product, partial [Effrenium voratum]
ANPWEKQLLGQGAEAGVQKERLLKKMLRKEKVEIRAANRRDMDIINLFGTRPGMMATQMKLAELVYQDPYAPEPCGGDLA